ncbi:TonB-dependent receptor plug domain-containing protein, partial [Staphylococcus equorum]|nr:TonB-dependent receptor plug domain-containing protein [Staphylococcus equorum]
GMMTQEVGIKSYVKVSLKPDNEMLDEVVVTGYGNFKKSSFTGAASSITTEKLQDIPSLSVQDKLAGAVAGVQVTSTSGQPGAVESVRIRGM